MGKILGAYLLPHPPIVISEIGRGEESKTANTIRAMKQVASDIGKKKPDTIILVTPHGPMFSDAIAISYEKTLKGSFERFGNSDLAYTFSNDLELVDKIVRNAGDVDVVCAKVDKEFAKEYGVSAELDHGALVPLYFINNEYKDFNLVHITYGLLSPIELYKFGMAINKSINETLKDVVFIASGDLSHKLTKDAPAGYNARGRDFDEEIVYLLEKGNFEGIMTIEPEFAEAAGECGLRSLQIMCGLLDDYNTTSEVHSYEGPFGVGYCVASIDVLEKSDRHKLLQKLIQREKETIKNIRNNEDEYVKLARNSLEFYVKNKRKMNMPENLPSTMLNEKAGVFVSIKKDGKLRGCIGTIQPSEENIAKEIIENAVKAGADDPRFYPVEQDELDKLIYSVDILKKPEEVISIDELDVYKYGVIVKKGNKTGLLLPALDGIDTPEQQVSIALQKAGINPTEGYSLYRFEVERHG
ncbi:AmmeMemoRadiSam system protein A [Caldisalinibacter kiritimatiensis]|uniref:AMMECR1 domain-containing protein n=1 Tax=Caldisalinibacter kiritimatiensis TaxID=1304284 RepID=R1AV41_9FIRM|nr:AmmeMemoRadiSam system protein A [Caldisalinibacter kiritimatiensis]EOD01028.1 hypothetical protein L21TH_0930 [Caldisalinibacter kiritimatiensis]